MKIILGPKQAQFLIDMLEEEISRQKEFQFEQYGSGGPSNPKTILANVRMARNNIKRCEQLLSKIEKEDATLSKIQIENLQDVFKESVTFD